MSAKTAGTGVQVCRYRRPGWQLSGSQPILSRTVR